ncbi:ferredoxin [Novipirellula artificiosorum]|uniref:Ferredoxin n=1 Tax=Novipirellula artificiosorum TaxID=2528016 RepID=A0A5C6D7C7_9BACT|nr:ferredoxin [Novipirellula artificiosorum]TWU31955.1 hypothetical protein Poly41_58430 [Novipirellula artificiosorum]
MQPSIKERIQNAWTPVGAELLGVIHQTISELDDLLKLDEYRQHGHEPAKLQEAMGPFAAASMNLDSLSHVLSQGRSARLLSPQRKQRIEKLLATLSAIRLDFEANPPMPVFVSMERPESEIEVAVDRHLRGIAALFQNLHIAQLEIRAKYQPDQHDGFFSDFRWHQLSPAEIERCPPFVVVAELDQDDAASIQKMVSLLGSRQPITILALRRSLKKVYPPAPDPINPTTATLELFPLFMRGVYAVQACIANHCFDDLLRQGITSSRPALVSLFWDDQVDDVELRDRSEKALLSRAFPTFTYDPDGGTDLASCLDLSTNPGLGHDWGTDLDLGRENETASAMQDRPYTFADFAFAESAFAGSFDELPAMASREATVPLLEYLSMTRPQRIGRIPYVNVVGSDGALIEQVPSADIVTQTSERMQLWRTLQELSGAHSPYVKRAVKETHTRVSSEHKTVQQNLRQELEQDADRREKAAVANAVRNLTAHLTGSHPGSIRLEELFGISEPVPEAEIDQESDTPPSPPKRVSPAAEPAKAVPPSGDGAWLETPLCTSCDECISVNDRIFAYNENKKAIIKNPKGGPYKDLVRAAEKCTAEIIHPGKPWDPSEKDVQKWVERAKRFQ